MFYEIPLSTSRREEFLDITGLVADRVRESGVPEGVCFVFIPHTTAGVTINEGADPDVKADIIKSLNRLIPRHGDYAHAEGNSDAHLKTTLTGVCQTVLLRGGRLLLGRWQSIYFCEYDGPRSRRIILNVQPA